MNILFIGDIVGNIGKVALKKELVGIKKNYNISFIIANVENVSNGRGISISDYNYLSELGIDSMTLGNHYLDKREDLLTLLSSNSEKEKERIVLPLNSKNIYLDSYSLEERSKQYLVKNKSNKIYDNSIIKVRVTSLLGKSCMNEEVEDPYLTLSKLIEIDDLDSDIHIVDYHAELNGEKLAITYAFLGEIQALIGTHTHSQTSDYRLIEDKTLYISDVGMSGSNEGIFGYTKESIIDRQIYNKNIRLKLIEEGEYVINAVILSFDDSSFIPTKIEPLSIKGYYEKE